MVGMHSTLLLTALLTVAGTRTVAGDVDAAAHRSREALQLRQDQDMQVLLPKPHSLLGASRSRRWVLPWLIGLGAAVRSSVATDGAAVKSSVATDGAAVKSSVATEPRSPESAINTGTNSSDYLQRAEQHLSSVPPLNLGRDTRINYVDARGRTGDLLGEEDAEVYDWALMQHDRNLTQRSYDVQQATQHDSYQILTSSYPSLARSRGGSVALQYQPDRTRPASGYVIRTNPRNGPQLNAFNRFPIAYEESLEYSKGNNSLL